MNTLNCVALDRRERQSLLLKNGNGKNYLGKSLLVTRKIAYEVLGLVPGTMQVLDTGAGKVQSNGARVRLGVTTYGVA